MVMLLKTGVMAAGGVSGIVRGLTSALPAPNAQAIKRDNPAAASGFYWIKTSRMTVARQVYCEMEYDGGGWMALSINNAMSTNSNPLYPSNWNNEGVLSATTRVLLNDIWYDSGEGYCTTIMRMGSTSSGTVPTYANMQMVHTVLYASPSLINVTASTSTTPTLVAGASVVAATWTAIKGYSSLVSRACNAMTDLLASTSWMQTNMPIGYSAPRSLTGYDIEGLNGTSTSNNTYGMTAAITQGTSSQRTDFRTFAIYAR